MKKYRALALFVFGATLLLASPSYGRNCATSVTNNVGDRITVTATLSTSDTGENGEGKPVFITTSGGEFVTTDSEYGLARVWTYTATAANETITGTFCSHGHESCSLSATSMSVAWLTPGQKAAASALAAGVAIVIVIPGLLLLRRVNRLSWRNIIPLIAMNVALILFLFPTFSSLSSSGPPLMMRVLCTSLGLLIIGCIGLPQAVSAVRAKGALRESAQMIVWFFLIFGSIHDIYKIFYKQ